MLAIAIVMILIILALVYVLLSRKRTMTPAKFIEAVKQRISENYPHMEIKNINGFEFTVVVNGNEERIYLNNTYIRYSHNPKYFDEIVDNTLNAVICKEEYAGLSWEQAKLRLLPSIKSKEYFEDACKLPGGADAIGRLISLEYIDGLKILIAIDSKMSISYVMNDQMTSWGVSSEELYKIALSNLAKLTAQHWPEAVELAKTNKVFAFGTQDGYDASRILLPDFYERVSHALECEKFLVGIPNRDFLAAIPADASWKNRFIEQVINDSHSYDNPVSDRIYKFPLENKER